MLCSHSPLRRFTPDSHIRDSQSHRDPHPRLNQGTQFAGLYLVDVSSASSATLRLLKTRDHGEERPGHRSQRPRVDRRIARPHDPTGLASADRYEIGTN